MTDLEAVFSPELRDVIIKIADDLYYDCRMDEDSGSEDPVWIAKYVERNYYPE